MGVFYALLYILKENRTNFLYICILFIDLNTNSMSYYTTIALILGTQKEPSTHVKDSSQLPAHTDYTVFNTSITDSNTGFRNLLRL